MKEQGSMPRKITLPRLLLLRLKMALLGSGKQETKASNDLKQWSIYTSARALPFDKFQEVCVEDNLNVLIISGEPPAEKLIEAWSNIYLNYIDIIDDTFSHKINEKVKTAHLQAKIQLAKNIVRILMLKQNDELMDILIGMGFKGSVNKHNRKSCVAYLDRVRIQIKFWELNVPTEKEENKENKKLSYEQFAKALFSLSKYAGYDMKASEISCFDFALRYSEMIKDLKKTKKNG